MTLKIEHLGFAYKQKPILRDISFTVSEGEFFCLAGVSGCGKSTLLRLIAGLEKPASGTITLNDTLLSSTSKTIPPEKRAIGLVFQHFSLFPHLTVLENVLFGMKEKHSQHAKDLLQTVHYDGDSHAYPHQLSGGQQQRVALARALATEPKLLLLDEPFANLDYGLRKALREETRALLKSKGITSIMVTHDPKEAMQMADTILLMTKDGGIRQQGSPQELYQKPVDSEAAIFFGAANLLKGTVGTDGFQTVLGICSIPHEIKEGQPSYMMLRPETILLSKEQTSLEATVSRVIFSGSHQMLELKVAESTILMDDYQLLPISEGDTVWLKADCSKAHIF